MLTEHQSTMIDLFSTPVSSKGFSIASQDSHHVHGVSWLCLPTSPYPTFFASAKPIIVATDNMLPKLHDKYTRHQWLKG